MAGAAARADALRILGLKEGAQLADVREACRALSVKW